MEDHLEAVIAARERLVDRVVDHLVDQMMEAARACRADVHARPQPDRLETLEHSDVFAGIRRLSHEKSPATCTFLGRSKSTRRSGRKRPSRGLRAQLFPLFCAVPPSRSRRPRNGPRAPGRRWPPGGAPAGPRTPPARPPEAVRERTAGASALTVQAPPAGEAGSRPRAARARTPTPRSWRSRAASRPARSAPATRSQPPARRPARAMR